MVVHDPDVCGCELCVDERFKPFWNQTEEPDMRSTKREIDISIVRGKASLPAYLGLFHRHFEKARPTVASAAAATVTAPIDQLDMLLGDSGLASDIESIEVRYAK